MKVTWYSNAPWCSTGYGSQTALFTPRMRDDGHEVTIAANFGLAGTPVDWQGITVIGQGYDSFSNDLAPAHHVRSLGDDTGWLLTLFDVWPLKFGELAHVASWVPVDHLTVPPDVAAWTRDHYTIAMSRFGQEALRAIGVDARYVPHGIDTSVFKPTPHMTNQPVSWRQASGIPTDAFLVGIVGANKGWPSRKGFPEMFSAMSIIMERHRDVHLYVHSDVTGFNGVDLTALAAALALPMDRVHFVDQFANRASLIAPRDMAAIYTGFDVLLSTSYGEGFGIPVVEAQACGVPVIVTEATSQPELVGAGWKVPGQPWWDAPQRSWWVVPNIGAIVAVLEDAYKDSGLAELRDQAVRFAQGYEAGHVYDTYWRPVLAELQTILDTPEPAPVNTAVRSKHKGRKR